MGQRRIRKALSRAFDALGYTVRRKRPPHWGEDGFRDQEHWLRGAPVRMVFDVGANVGDMVQAYRTMFPGAAIHAFEPFPDVHRRLAARFASDPQVRPHQAAVAEDAGTRRFHVNEAHQTNSLFPLNPTEAARAMAGAPDSSRIIEVPTVTLDGFCAREGIAAIDLLKMDIQGGEGLALEGAAGLLSRRAVRLICLEVLFAPLYQGQAYFCDVAAILARHRYRLGGLYWLHQDERGLAWGDAIFLPE